MFQNTKPSRNLAKMLLVAVLFSFGSCKEGNNTDTIEIKKTKNIVKISTNNAVYITEIDSCEYIIFDGFEKGGIIHKQNCKFCLARHAE